MNWLDFLIIGLIGWFAFSGLSAGILRESVTLIAAVAGVVLAGLLYKPLAEDLSIITDSVTTARIAAFAAIFFAVFLAGQIAATLLKHTASLLMLGPLDHSAGLLFGIGKGVVVIEAALMLFAQYRVQRITEAMDSSLLTPLFLEGIPIVLRLLPGEFRQAVERFPNL